jgi:hypothetical protein
MEYQIVWIINMVRGDLWHESEAVAIRAGVC